eukprot:1416655-Pyramimonas_sp.AAC.1
MQLPGWSRAKTPPAPRSRQLGDVEIEEHASDPARAQDRALLAAPAPLADRERRWRALARQGEMDHVSSAQATHEVGAQVRRTLLPESAR